MEELCGQLINDPKVVCLFLALVLVLIILIIMQVWKVGYYKGDASEKLTSSGVEIPPNYICNTDFASDVIPNGYPYGTGGISRGAAGRHGQVTSDYSGLGRMAGYMYTTRMDENVRDYADVNSPMFDIANPNLFIEK